MLTAGPPPGRSIYSQVVVPETSEPTCEGPSLLCARPKWSKHWQAFTRPETAEEGTARYWVIAQAIAHVVPKNRRLRALMLTVYNAESGLRRDVHAGIGGAARGDQGRSCGLGQALLGVKSKKCDAITGLSLDATIRNAEHTSKNLKRAERYCSWQIGTRRVGCTLRVYGGVSIGAKHKGIAARINSFHRFSIRKVPPLSDAVRAMLGLDDMG